MTEGKGLRSWLLVALAAALLLSVTAAALPQEASAEKCFPECIPPPEEDPEVPPPPKPPLAPKLLVVNIGWETGRATGSAPLEAGNLTRHVEHLRNVVNPWFRSVSPLFKPWTIELGGSFTIQAPTVLANGAGCDLAPGISSFQREVLERGDAVARAHGVDFSAYHSVVYVWSRETCLAAKGFHDTATHRIGLATTTAAQHELGHLLGIPHEANSLRCEDANGNPVTLSNRCTSVEYGDTFDTMGGNFNGAFNAIYQDRLGWMSGEVASVSAGDFTRSWTLKPMSEPGLGLRAIRLVDGPTTLWIEYRQPTGADAPRVPAQQGLAYGVLIHREVEGRSQIIDMTPQGPFEVPEQPGLRAGQSWANPLGEMKVTVTNRSLTAATVTLSSSRVTVPSVRGLDPTRAQAIVAAAALRSNGWSPVVDFTCNFLGVVAEQEPFAGARVLPGTEVRLAVGEPHPTAPCF